MRTTRESSPPLVSPQEATDGPIDEECSLTFKQVTAFLAVVQHGSIADAASQLHLSSSALSRIIRDTELALGVTLLERTPQGIKPSAAGQAFMPHAQHLAKCYASLVSAPVQASPARFVVGCSNVVLPHILPRLLECRPLGMEGVALELRELPSQQIRELLASGDADLGLMLVPERDAHPDHTPLLRAPLGLLVSPSIHIPESVPSLDVISGLPFARLTDDMLIPQALRSAGVHCEAYFGASVTISSMPALISSVAQGRLATIVSGIAASSPIARTLQFLPLPDLLPWVHLSILKSAVRPTAACEHWEPAVRSSVLAVEWHACVELVTAP